MENRKKMLERMIQKTVIVENKVKKIYRQKKHIINGKWKNRLERMKQETVIVKNKELGKKEREINNRKNRKKNINNIHAFYIKNNKKEKRKRKKTGK